MKKNRFYVATLLLIVLSFLISTVTSLHALYSTMRRENEELTKLSAQDIYNEINNRLQEHVIAGKALASNEELLRLLEHEEKFTRDEMENILKKDLGAYVDRLGYNTAFLVSDKTGCYYTQKGFNKVVRPESDPHDIWYTTFLESGQDYEFDIDVDEVHEYIWTVFLNVRVEDAEGNLLGVCGIGTEMTDMQELIRRMQAEYDIKVDIVDQNGIIQMDSNDLNIEKAFYSVDLLQKSSEDFHIEETEDGYFITKYMADLGWSLVIRKETDMLPIIMEVVGKNLIIMAAIFVVFFLVSTVLLRRGNQKMVDSIQMRSYGALAEAYASMYLLDYRTGAISVIKRAENMYRYSDDIAARDANDGILFDLSRTVFEQIDEVIERWIEQEYKEEVRTFVDFSSLGERLATKGVVSHEFILKSMGWCRGTFLKTNEYGEEKYIFAITLIEEEKREQEALLLESERAKAASEAKGRFLAHMSHEIRTPINAVLGMDTMILRESKEPEIREYAMNIQTAGQTLLSLVNDILDFSKIESGKMEIAEVEYDLSILVNDVLNMIRVRAEAKQLQVDVSVDRSLPRRLIGDDVRLRQVLVNLMTNAVKYTEKGKIFFILGKASEKNAEENAEEIVLHFEVRDTGIGIRQEDMGRLFADFERIGEPSNHNVEGTGLGMSITKQLLALMNSKLEVSSVYGEGSVFSFDVVQKIADEREVGDFRDSVSRNAEEFKYETAFVAPEARILVIDDNRINRLVLCGLLKQTQIQIDQAADGMEALEKIGANSYDIIFVDHMMEGVDGLEVMRRVLENPNHPNQHSIYVALTANAVTGAREMYMEAGFHAYLTKPILPEELEKLIGEYIPDEKKQGVS